MNARKTTPMWRLGGWLGAGLTERNPATLTRLEWSGSDSPIKETKTPSDGASGGVTPRRHKRDSLAVGAGPVWLPGRRPGREGSRQWARRPASHNPKNQGGSLVFAWPPPARLAAPHATRHREKDAFRVAHNPKKCARDSTSNMRRQKGVPGVRPATGRKKESSPRAGGPADEAWRRNSATS